MVLNKFLTNLVLSALASSVCFGQGQPDAVSDAAVDPDMVVIAYNSYDARSDTLVFASVDENEDDDLEGGGNVFSTINVGMGNHLWQIDEYGPELKRGWMFRLRLTIQAVMDEYNRRGQQDFVAMVSDAADVYVSKSITGQTVAELKRRFLTDFATSQIVFSTQVYCCNPWELHSFGRADWDQLFMEQGPDGLPPSMYKHLNAGLYMGYASAIIQMADEMKIWTTDYHRHESFWSLVGTEAAKSLHMEDLEVDDDEWQISAWFFRDQDKETPLASLDFDQNLFAVTGTFRAAQDDEGFQVYSREHFFDMFGPLPASFTPEDIGSLTVCPYDYDKDAKLWTNQITGGHPLLFHFAGNDWLCACTVFAAEGFTGITGKFRNNCQYELAKWYDIVQNGIQHIASVADPATEKMVQKGDELIVIEPKVVAALVERRLGDNDMEVDSEQVPDRRQLQMKKGPYRRELGDDQGPYRRQLQMKKGPYRRELNDDQGPYRRQLQMKKGPYRRELGDDQGPYRRELGDDQGPYRRQLQMKKGPYRRELGDNQGPYRRQLQMKKGPYRRELGDDQGPYRRQLQMKKGPYRRELGDNQGPYRRQLGNRQL